LRAAASTQAKLLAAILKIAAGITVAAAPTFQEQHRVGQDAASPEAVPARSDMPQAGFTCCPDTPQLEDLHLHTHTKDIPVAPVTSTTRPKHEAKVGVISVTTNSATTNGLAKLRNHIDPVGSTELFKVISDMEKDLIRAKDMNTANAKAISVGLTNSSHCLAQTGPSHPPRCWEGLQSLAQLLAHAGHGSSNGSSFRAMPLETRTTSSLSANRADTG
jgi:hypothetical protein